MPPTPVYSTTPPAPLRIFYITQKPGVKARQRAGNQTVVTIVYQKRYSFGNPKLKKNQRAGVPRTQIVSMFHVWNCFLRISCELLTITAGYALTIAKTLKGGDNMHYVYVDGMANGHAVTYRVVNFPCRSSAVELATALVNEARDVARLRLPLVSVMATPTRLQRLARGVRRVARGQWRYGVRIITSTLTIGDNMATPYIDQATLELAKLVASAEGITLTEALADQLELFGE